MRRRFTQVLVKLPMLLTAIACLTATILTGCSDSEGEARSVAPAPVLAKPFNEQALPVVAFEVPAMMCEDSCARTVQRVLADMPGAADVRVNFEAKTAEVAVDGELFDAEQAVALLLDYGFDDSKIAAAAGAATQARVEATP